MVGTGSFGGPLFGTKSKIPTVVVWTFSLKLKDLCRCIVTWIPGTQSSVFCAIKSLSWNKHVHFNLSEWHHDFEGQIIRQCIYTVHPLCHVQYKYINTVHPLCYVHVLLMISSAPVCVLCSDPSVTWSGTKEVCGLLILSFETDTGQHSY